MCTAGQLDAVLRLDPATGAVTGTVGVAGLGGVKRVIA
jgi:hypothetical protein